jgi:periplasmic protein CpxP/Spy
MKKIILTLSILGCLVTNAVAQERAEMPKTNQAMPKGNDIVQKVQQSIESIDKACGGLTDEQRTKITAINTEKFTKIAEIRAKMKGGDKETAKKEIESIRNSYKGNIRQLLTPEQIAKLKETAKMNKKDDKKEGKKGKKDKKGKKEKGENKHNDTDKDALDDLDKEDLEK